MFKIVPLACVTTVKNNNINVSCLRRFNRRLLILLQPTPIAVEERGISSVQGIIASAPTTSTTRVFSCRVCKLFFRTRDRLLRHEKTSIVHDRRVRSLSLSGGHLLSFSVVFGSQSTKRKSYISLRVMILQGYFSLLNLNLKIYELLRGFLSAHFFAWSWS